MKALIILFLLFVLSGDGSYAQSNWEIILGPSYTNVRHIQNDQQIIYNHTLNAPLWNIGFQAGIRKYLPISNKTRVHTGIQIELKGDRKSRHVIFPDDDYYGIRFLYLTVPLHFDLKLLNSYDIYLTGGISGDFLIHQNEIKEGVPFFQLQNFGERFGLSTQIGFNYQVSKFISIGMLYSQALTSIYTTESAADDGNDITYYHQGFLISFGYKL